MSLNPYKVTVIYISSCAVSRIDTESPRMFFSVLFTVILNGVARINCWSKNEIRSQNPSLPSFISQRVPNYTLELISILSLLITKYVLFIRIIN